MINVLLLAAGKRTELARKLIEKNCKLWAYESDPYSPIAHYATLIRGLDFNNPELITDLTLNIAFHSIDLVIPCYDNVIPILSEIKESTDELCHKIVCPSRKTAKICFNKELFEKFMIERFPEYYPSIDEDSDILGKPIYGCGSRGIYIIKKDESIGHRKRDNYIYQRYVTGKEYTVDVYFNKKGTFIGAVPRLREKVCDGEVINSSIVWDEELIKLSKDIGKELELVGPACFQFRQDEKTNKYLCFEINSRLGGGTTFSIAAGLNIIDYIIDEYVYNNPVFPIYESQINKNLILRRTLQDHFFEKK